jgi:hypothetical protein
MSAVSDQSYYSSQNYHPRLPQSGSDFIDRYSQAPAYTAQRALSAKSHNRVSQLQAQDYHNPPIYAPQVQSQYYHATATILPPIRAQDPIDPYAQQYVAALPEPKPKEEKATGGVAAHLDYDMDLMSSFVAEMSQGIVSPGVNPTSQYRKYVSQILSSTRLPSSTIMLGLFYLTSRMKIVAARGDEIQSSGTVYRMLTICLLLGSKFLDDNTFQNRSWAEVSSIPVQELNIMELQWLKDFNWIIHGPMYHKEEGFFKWIDHWHAYEEKAQMAKVKNIQKLAPIETNLHRSRSVIQQPLMSPEGPIPPQYQQSAQYDTQWARQYLSEYSPPSAPHSGPATPDYYNSSGNWSYTHAPPAYSRSSWNSNQCSAYAAQRSQPPSYQPTPSYQSQNYSQSLWAGHGPNCGCTLCAKHSDYYFSYPNGMATVVG